MDRRLVTKDPIRQTDDHARQIVQHLLSEMRHATLGTLDPDSGTPLLTRIAMQLDEDGTPIALLSGLSAHTRALKADPRAGLLITDANATKGDVMTHPRLSILARAMRAKSDPDRRRRWLKNDPKAQIYIDLPDFNFWRFEPHSGLLNAGFARAYRLTPEDMTKPPQA